MADPVSTAAIIKALQRLATLSGLLPQGGGVPRFLRRNIRAVIRAQQQQPLAPINPGGNAPPPGEAPPIRLPSPGVDFIPESWRYGSKGPRRRPRVGRRRRYTRGYFPPGPWDCESDTECYEQCIERGGDPELCANPPPPTARGPMPSIPVPVPPPIAVPDAPVATPGAGVVRVLSRVLNPFLWVFWPSTVDPSSDDWYPLPSPQRPPAKGPQRRPSVGTPPQRAPIRLPRGPFPGPDWSVPTDPYPRTRPRPETEAPPRPSPSPAPTRIPDPTRLPVPGPTRAPSPAPPRTFPRIPLFPLLLPSFPTPSPQLRVRPRPGTEPPPLSDPLPTPLTLIQPQPLPSRADRCPEPQKRKRKPRKPRAICYRGTYTEKRNGLLKRKRERIPCR